MKIGVSIKIDVNKIEKARLFKGEKGTYLDLTTFIDLDDVDQYGNNGAVQQSCSKEERESGVKMPYIGNVKIFTTLDGGQQKASAPAYDSAPDPAVVDDGFDDPIPF